MTLVERLLTLVKIDSVTGREGPLCDYLARCFASVDEYVVDRIGNSMALRPRERRHAHMVGFAGHLDTVPPSGDNPARIQGDRLFGLGASDMKSGVALMWQLIEEPVADPEYDLAFIFYEGEEGPYEQSGLGPLLAQLHWLQDIDLAFCLEPSDNVLQLGCLGTVHAEVTFVGRAAHSARPWQGDNAIHKAAALLTYLAKLEPMDVSFGGLTYREVLSATTASGGRARNMVPDQFTLNLNYRFAPGRTPSSAKAYVRQVVGEDVGLRFVDLAPAGAVPDDNPLLSRFQQICPVPVAPKQAWTDVARLDAVGIDAVNFGPGDNAQAHQPRESTSISKLNECGVLMRRFLSH